LGFQKLASISSETGVDIRVQKSSDVEVPGHVSVVFARVVVSYFSRVNCIRIDQNILDKPTATIIDRREVFVTYKGEDKNLDYILFPPIQTA